MPSAISSIAAITLARRLNTRARQNLLQSGISARNLHRVNFLCAFLLGRPPLNNSINVRGIDVVALYVAGIALSLACVAFGVQLFIVIEFFLYGSREKGRVMPDDGEEFSNDDVNLAEYD